MKKKHFLFIVCTLLFVFNTNAQRTFFQKSDTLNNSRLKGVYLTEATLATVTLVGLHQLWYADFPKSKFHFNNDNKDWLQMDKMGHMMTSYYIGKLGMSSLDWAGSSKKQQLVYGATLGFAFLTAVEVFDGYSKEWGASPGDILANAAGTGLLVGQELLWNEQRIKLKYSFHRTSFAAQRPNTLGSNFSEELLKDYNGQTYWLSANIWSFHKKSNFPKWLNIAIGFGAQGMLYSQNKNQELSLPTPYRQFYAGLDVDLTKIKTKSKFLKALFNTINFIKIPAPAIEFTSKGKIKTHLLYF
ncbi:DUF2279 domain-containing protein [Flavicella sediminum]|uniref:DUF2279 domain-containing protein n=1 Tax=Flavicella sediminum TaxID=2585141 RepID=UPI001FB80B67|nr:DUF2279 domain-containing protein [Flavicella sediminum]